MSAGEALVREFSRLVAREGGVLQLLGDDEGVIRVGYRPGVDPTCDEGACVLPHVELQQLMSETLARRDPARSVVVELIA
jgi:hypothetical protein